MPVTAKLSKAFYERFGDKIVNEFVDWFNQVDATYKADLRELNESNFSRFDAKLGERLAALDGKWTSRIVALEAKLDQKVSEVAFRGELAELRSKDLANIRIELREREGRMLRWMFAYWITTIGTMIALLRLWG